jgi:hypothetical protein
VLKKLTAIAVVALIGGGIGYGVGAATSTPEPGSSACVQALGAAEDSLEASAEMTDTARSYRDLIAQAFEAGLQGRHIDAPVFDDLIAEAQEINFVLESHEAVIDAADERAQPLIEACRGAR